MIFSIFFDIFLSVLEIIPLVADKTACIGIRNREGYGISGRAIFSLRRSMHSLFLLQKIHCPVCPVGRVSFSVLFKSEIFGVGFKIFLGKVFIAETGQKRARSLVMTDRERKTAALYLGQQTVGFDCFVNARPRACGYSGSLRADRKI